MAISIEDDAFKIRTAMYIIMLSWRRKSDDVKRGYMCVCDNPIVIWKKLLKEFKQQFYLEYVDDEAWAKLCQLY